MTYQVDVQTEVEIPDQIKKDLELAISLTLFRHDVPAGALTLLLTNDARMQRLNQSFRGADKTTDVLSFPAGDPLPGMSNPIPYLGDIAISLPVAKNQAKISGHTLLAELQLLAVHGVLHLLEYDHLTPGDKARMWSVQNEILTRLGLHNIAPTEV